MASTATKKKGTTKKTTGGRRKAAPPAKRPVRREAGGIVCLVLALCATVNYFGVDAVFIDWFAVLLKGLFGYGYWLAGPSLVLAGLILLLHHGRPVAARVTCALLITLLFGTLTHMILLKDGYEVAQGLLKTLWTTGNALQSGGAVSGLLAVGAVMAFSRIASIIIFVVLALVLLLSLIHI